MISQIFITFLACIGGLQLLTWTEELRKYMIKNKRWDFLKTDNELRGKSK